MTSGIFSALYRLTKLSTVFHLIQVHKISTVFCLMQVYKSFFTIHRFIQGPTDSWWIFPLIQVHNYWYLEFFRVIQVHKRFWKISALYRLIVTDIWNLEGKGRDPIEAPSWHFPWGTEETRDKPQMIAGVLAETRTRTHRWDSHRALDRTLFPLCCSVGPEASLLSIFPLVHSHS